MMEGSSKGISFLAGAGLVALGLTLGGYFVGSGFEAGRSDDRYVTVKGLAEQEVTADAAIWGLQVSAASDDLATAQAKIRRDTGLLQRYFREAGLEDTEISAERLQVIDQLAQAYRSGPIDNNRFIINQIVMIRSDKVALVSSLTSRTNEVLELGLVVSEWAPPSYSFNRLNDIKPAMIAEATEAARASAAQFAEDSDSAVGAILRANQGTFSIQPRDRGLGQDESLQVNKIVRAVVTIDYALEE